MSAAARTHFAFFSCSVLPLGAGSRRVLRWLPAVPSVSNCHVVDDDDLDCQRSRQALLVGSIIASAAEMADSLNLRVKAWQADAAKPPCLDNGIA